jgi:PTS system nitrogen regulatory IIA component
MKLIEVLRPECVRARADIGDKESALELVASLAKESPLLEGVSKEEILEALHEREGLGTTGFGKGIAIPHCRLEGPEGFVVGLITPSEPVDFDAMDGEPVRLFAFIIAPALDTNDHIRLLSAISQTFLDPAAVDELAHCPTSEALYESLLRYSDVEPAEKGHDEKSLIITYVQYEDVFRDLLQVFAGLDTECVAAVDAEGASVYLRKLPLFAGFWSDKESDFLRIIQTVLNRRLTNEALRRIESVTGPLDECHGVVVAILPIAYCAGMLDV